MVTIQYEKHKCDICGKIVDVDLKEGEWSKTPMDWLTINVTVWGERVGTGRFHREVCSIKCLKKCMHEFKELDEPEPIQI